MQDTKECTKCKEVKALDQFTPEKGSKLGVRSQCKPCRAITNSKWAKANRETINETLRDRYKNDSTWKDHEYNKHYIKTYGITLEQYNQMFTNQNGNCAICSRNQSEFARKLHVDHDHLTGRVRGLLCGPCNKALGGFQDNPDLLRKAAKYVE